MAVQAFFIMDPEKEKKNEGKQFVSGYSIADHFAFGHPFYGLAGQNGRYG